MTKKILAILAAVGIFSSGVYAGGNFQSISVSFDAVKKIVIFGQDRTPSDVKPFVYNNTTYVPLRYVSEELKVPVSWDGSTGTVYLGESPVRASEEAVLLVNQPISSTYRTFLYRINNKLESTYNVDEDASFSFPQTFVMRLMEDPNNYKATAYDNGISLKVDDKGTALYYAVGGKYKTLSGVVGFDSELNNKNYQGLKIKIIGDGVIFKEIDLSSEKLFEKVNLDITGVKNLAFDFSHSGKESYEPIINMVNMILK